MTVDMQYYDSGDDGGGSSQSSEGRVSSFSSSRCPSAVDHNGEGEATCTDTSGSYDYLEGKRLATHKERK